MKSILLKGWRKLVREKIKQFLDENYDWICEELQDAAKESFSVSESGAFGEMISVVLTKNFKLRVINHHRSYNFTEDVLYVLYSFECETYEVDYYDVTNYLTSEQVDAFQQYLLTNAKALMELENDSLEEFLDLSEDEQLDEVIRYIDGNYLVLETFELFDEKLHEAYIANIYVSACIDAQVDRAKDQMYDNLYIFEE